MRIDRRRGRLAIVLPAIAGLGLLAGGLMLLPNDREILHAERRAQPALAASSSIPSALVAPPTLPPAHPAIAAQVATADAATLAALTAQLIADGQSVTTVQVAYDLAAAKRPAVALDYLAARPDGASAATWRLRVDLLRRIGRTADAAALVAQAAQKRGPVPAADIVAAAYAVDRPDLVIVAAANHVIPPPDAMLSLDLARRADTAGRNDLIALLDKATMANWRAADPWLAIRVAARAKDTAAGLRAADYLPVEQRPAARETILTEAGDRDGLRTELLAHAAAPGAQPEKDAERLLAAGFRSDAIAVLRQAATGQPPTAPAAQRLLYLMGPRPGVDDLAWLKQQSLQGSATQQRSWMARYAERDRPGEALAFLSRHPLASQTDVMLMRLSLARTAGNDAAGRTVLTGLLDGRALDAAQVGALSAAAPAKIDPAQAAAIAKRRIASGVAAPRDQIDLAWTAWNAGDAKGAAKWLDEHLETDPTDLPALRLMADVQARIGGDRAARPWLERALAQTPVDSKARVDILEKLGRRSDALAMVEKLRAETPHDRSLAAQHARLLIAQGQAGRARTVLAQ
jgi:tetratricopeptide (TPR) repeat protein